MKPHFPTSALIPVLALFLALVVTSCSTVESRIRENPAAFAAQAPATQEKIRKGGVEVGFTPELVYIALGKPDDEIRSITKNGEDATWLYNSYQQDYVGTAHTGYRRYIVVDPRTGRPVVLIEPVYTDVYQEHVDERIRVVFKSGKVSAIEEVRR